MITGIKVTVIDDGIEKEIFNRIDVTEIKECRASFGVYEIMVMDLPNKFLSGEFEIVIQGKVKELTNQSFDKITEIKE